MFSSWGNYVAPAEDLTEKERSPPPSPTLPDFPQAVPQPQNNPLTKASLRDLRRVLLGLRSQADVKREHLEALNVKISSDVPISDLIPTQEIQPPGNGNGDELPPKILLSNGIQFPGPEKLDLLERELQFENNDAFREVVRLPPAPGRQRLKLTQTRKFWTGLEKMSQYWDTSVDQFYEGPADAKRVKMDVPKSPPDGDAMNLDNESGTNPVPLSENATQTRTRYKGRRIGNGKTMPEDYREEAIRGFLEMVAWAFGCQVVVPTMPPRLAVGTVMFPVRHTFTVIRIPKDRMLARKGMVEGPVMVAQCKNDISFRDVDDRIGDGFGEATDLFREVGALLLLAQERARQHQTEKIPGEGKWWTSKVRWGGGPGGEVELKPETESVGDEPRPSVNETKPKTPAEMNVVDTHSPRLDRRSGLPSRRGAQASSSTKRLTLAERWKILKPGSGLWEKRFKYRQVGKVKGDDFDDVYLVSSINTHISLVHLRVHPDYLLWLEDDTETPPSTALNESARVLHLHRTKWYNLFDAQDRVEAMKGLWAIMGWMMRVDTAEHRLEEVEKQT